MEQLTLMIAIRKHLMLPGEGIAEIKKSMESLTPQDKLDLTRDFAAIGVEIIPAKMIN